MAGVPTILVEAMHQTTHSHFITFVSFSLFSQDVVQYRFRRPRRPPRASQRLEGGYRTCVWPCHQVSCTVLSCFVSCYAWCWLKETWSSLVSFFYMPSTLTMVCVLFPHSPASLGPAMWHHEGKKHRLRMTEAICLFTRLRPFAPLLKSLRRCLRHTLKPHQ